MSDGAVVRKIQCLCCGRHTDPDIRKDSVFACIFNENGIVFQEKVPVAGRGGCLLV